MSRMKLLLVLSTTILCAAQEVPPAPTAKTLEPGIVKFLEQKGDFCLGKFVWPIVVTQRDRAVATNDALQMPVLERLGVVASVQAKNEPSTTVYALTEQGQNFYLRRPVVTHGVLDEAVLRPGDLCVARLTLDKVVAWQLAPAGEGAPQVTVKYTYQVSSSAPWASDAEFQKVFPLIGKVLRGGGEFQLEQALSWLNGAWVPVTDIK